MKTLDFACKAAIILVAVIFVYQCIRAGLYIPAVLLAGIAIVTARVKNISSENNRK